MTRRPPKQPPAKRLTDSQRRQLDKFAKLLNDRITEAKVPISKLARYTALQKNTIRSYTRALNRPTKISLARLCMIFGEELGAPFVGTELAGPDHEPVSAIHLPNGMAILITHILVTETVLARVLEALHDSRVAESPPLYGKR